MVYILCMLVQKQKYIEWNNTLEIIGRNMNYSDRSLKTNAQLFHLQWKSPKTQYVFFKFPFSNYSLTLLNYLDIVV